MALKSVDWSYPTSPNAERLGRGKTGGWTVSVQPDLVTPSKGVSIHETEREAIDAAKATPDQWHPLHAHKENRP